MLGLLPADGDSASKVPGLNKVNGDLGMYKGLLSKLAAAKELQKEIFDREKRKDAERAAKKAEAAAKKAAE